jgi:hypothetical protein
MAVSSAGLRPKSDCSDKAQKQLYSKLQTRPLVREGATLQNNKPATAKEISRRKKSWLPDPDGCLTPRRTGRLIVGCKLTSNSTWVVQRLRLAFCKWPNWIGHSLSSPEDGNRSSFRNVMFSGYVDIRTMAAVQKLLCLWVFTAFRTQQIQQNAVSSQARRLSCDTAAAWCWLTHWFGFMTTFSRLQFRTRFESLVSVSRWKIMLLWNAAVDSIWPLGAWIWNVKQQRDWNVQLSSI